MSPRKPLQLVENEALDLGKLFLKQASCGYTQDVRLYASDVQKLTARMRGILAITSVFIAASDGEALKLSEVQTCGLAEAIHELANDAISDIDMRHGPVEGGTA